MEKEEMQVRCMIKKKGGGARKMEGRHEKKKEYRKQGDR